MSEVTLLPCPACGCDALIEGTLFCQLAGYCETCHMSGPPQNTENDAIAAWNSLPRALTWTTEPPKVSGFYWAKQKKEIQPVKVQNIYGTMCVFIIGCDIDARIYDIDMWAGPIPMPQEPNP